MSGMIDVVVVGAGAAGLQATRTLLDLGYRVLLVEAQNRIGGRAFTDHSVFGIPWDKGAHWIHNGRSNPYHNIANRLGCQLNSDPDTYSIFNGKREITSIEEDSFWNTYDEVDDAITEAGLGGKDISAEKATEHIQNEWSETVKFMLGAWEMGKPLDEVSTMDWAKGAGGEDFFCGEGYGSIVARHNANVPVMLNTVATKVDWSRKYVSVETSAGTIQTRTVLLTVSTGILAANRIKFIPQLPNSKVESFSAIPMGYYDHITLQFTEDVFGLVPNGYFLQKVEPGRKSYAVLTNASGSGLAYCDVGGNFAQQLQQESEKYRVNYVLDDLASLLGNQVKRAFVKGAATSWGLDHWTLGSYASASPGNYSMREVLCEPVAEKVFFAGEACHPTQWATVGGAYLSGQSTAQDISKHLALT